jgi:hypothetical protein
LYDHRFEFAVDFKPEPLVLRRSSLRQGNNSAAFTYSRRAANNGSSAFVDMIMLDYLVACWWLICPDFGWL